ncbi:MAG TPA: CpaD family pilus assembly lipoprotein [Rickettsiales bacterium]|nr:CpaD family pilus assembly lipoprotein [Rickettsiales bacterium]
MQRISSVLVLAAWTILATGCDSAPEQKMSNACPNWSSNASHDYQNTEFSGFGCAYYNNLSVQVANPDDLHMGHGDMTGSGDRESAVLDRYMKATQEALPVMDVTSSMSGR